MYYILKGKFPHKVNDVLEWARWFENKDNRIVKQDYIEEILISTVFLGLNHQYNPDGWPLLFETMIFGGKHDQYQDRYLSWDEAELGHKKALEFVSKKVKEKAKNK